MLKARRPAAAALILGVGALALTGCFSPPPLPSAAPEPPAAPSTSAEPSPTGEPTEPTEEPTTSSEPAASGDLPFTVDDGLGDIWSFDVVELVSNPPLSSGEPEPGTYVVGVIIDAEHVEGGVSFANCFDILVEGSDGEIYDYADTIGITPEDDIYFADDDAFTGAVAAVQLPEGVDPVSVTMRSTYGHPEVEDVVINITS
ncbi:hypothetical protein [Agrococcus sp. ProA11]|uniref:hypothetical protein n=1 Tax=Agrococcus chionoecetis TaxID=3153752 RepID=UPI00326114EC